jgi:DNA-binding XRE family transcriptional regulator
MRNKDLAAAADINYWYLSLLERGGRCRLGWGKLCDVATALDVSVELLLREAEAAPNEMGSLTIVVSQKGLSGPNRTDIGLGVRRIRLAQDLSIAGLAEVAGMHRTSVSCIERGQRQPGWSTLCALARALDVPVSKLAATAEAQTSEGHSVKRR